MREGERDRVFLLTWPNPNHVEIKILIFFGPLLFSVNFSSYIAIFLLFVYLFEFLFKK